MKTYLKIITAFLLVVSVSCSDSSDDYYPADNEYIPISGEQYNAFDENPFINTQTEPVSTFAIDADGAAYSNMRRFLNSNTLPERNSVRIEELINYFNYNYEEPLDEHPVALSGEVSSCPWNEEHKLLRIGFKGTTIPDSELAAANIVLLIDVSGSMSSDNKLNLLKESFHILVDEMRENDRIAIVTYAGSSEVVLQSTSGANKQEIYNALNNLEAGGSTAGAQGIVTAYDIALQYFVENGNNRIIIGSDGDFNVGVSSQEELIDLIESKRDMGIYLTVLGVGIGNLNDAMMEQLADHGNGNYEYIDNIEQARKLFDYEFKKLYTVAKDCKVQIHFNTDYVAQYRLIGYENRMLSTDDFTNDAEDAGEIGSSQTITAIYEIITQPSAPKKESFHAFTIDFRYKNPNNNAANQIQLQVFDYNIPFLNSSENMRFAASVAAFGMLLINSQYKGNVTYNNVTEWAQNSSNFDLYGFKQEFISLVEKAQTLSTAANARSRNIFFSIEE